MASFKVILLKHKIRGDKTSPLALRIGSDRRSKYIYLKIYLSPQDWNEKGQNVRQTHPNHAEINTMIKAKLLQAQRIFSKEESNERPATAMELKKKIRRGKSPVTFFHFAEGYLNKLLAIGNIKVYKSDRSRINNFKNFMKHTDLRFEDITTERLREFITYLKVKRELKPRSIANHIILFRTLFNKAISEQIVERNYYPFGRGKLTVRIPESQKIGLDETEIKKIEALDLSTYPLLNYARDMFLISFYHAGIRAGDLLKLRWGDFKDGRLFYVMAKNNKPGSIKVNEKAKKILERIRPPEITPEDLVFPDLKEANFKDPRDLERKMNTAKGKLNDRLKKIAEIAGIEKKLTSHIARHSFGYIAGDKIPMPVLQNLYRHSSILTTVNYQQSFTNKEADEAMDKVLGF